MMNTRQKLARGLAWVAVGLFFPMTSSVIGQEEATHANVSAEMKPDGSSQSEEQLAKRLKKIVESQSAAWNQGDIDEYMEAYWKDKRLSFSSGGTTEYGWTKVRDRYKRRYHTRDLMGKLAFSELSVQRLDKNSAMMLGRWQLTRENPIGGNFTLVWKRIDRSWVIVHDHTSVLEESP